MRNCSGIKTAVLLILASLAAGTQDNFDAGIERGRQTFEVPGIAVAIVKDGRVVLEKGYGVRKLGEPAKATPQSRRGLSKRDVYAQLLRD